MQPPKCYLIVPTFRREDRLRATLESLRSIAGVVDEVLVVDNASSELCREVCESVALGGAPLTRYVDAGSNLGPAGATALGMSVLLTAAADNDWIVRCDDDSSAEWVPGVVEIFATANRLREADDRVAAVGTAGSRFDVGRCRLDKPPRCVDGVVDVDYLATGFFPFYSVGAVRQVGVFRSDFFFGLDELEYGLRLRTRGYRVCRIDDETRTRTPSVRRLGLEDASWHRYYSLRNLVVIALEHCGRRRAISLCLTRGVLKPLLNLPIHPILAFKHLRMNLAAIRHAFEGRMGRVVDPPLDRGQLPTRS